MAISAQLHALADALQVVTDGKSSADIVAEMSLKADALLAALPDDFAEPLLKRSDLSNEQVRKWIHDSRLAPGHQSGRLLGCILV